MQFSKQWFASRSSVFRDRLRSLRERLPSRGAVSAVLKNPAKYAAIGALAFAGCWLGLYLGASSYLPVGPVETTMRLVPTIAGDTSVMVPPLGTLFMDSHDGPLRLDVTVDRIDQEDARRIMADPAVLEALQTEVTDDLRNGLTQTLARAFIAGTLGAGLITLLVLRRVKPTLIVSGVTAGALLASFGVAGLTWNPRAITEPKFDGLLSSAPSVIGNARDIAENFDAYSGELAKLVTNVTKLYDVTSALPNYAPSSKDVLRVLHISDLHLGEHAWGIIASVVRQYEIDVIVDSGDISDRGSAAENAFFQPIANLGVPYVFVRGNHDSVITEEGMRRLPNTVVLDGSVREVKGIRFLGAGDPRFTPDRQHRDFPGESEAVAQQARAIGEVAKRETSPVDVLVYHDTAGAPFLDGKAGLILTGHGHTRMNLLMPKGSRLMQEGTTGGGGLRALQVEPGHEPAPVSMSVLYLGRDTKQLEAWDEITLGGLGLTSAEIERHQVNPGAEEPSEPSPGPTPTLPAPGTPVKSPTFSPTPLLPSDVPSLLSSQPSASNGAR